ncbi:MAG: DUF4154 domain-containing protein [Phaeodactylibacter sp.]|nr:DUF4154 domain-containing protein [Phaeodactylibacter sp.]
MRRVLIHIIISLIFLPTALGQLTENVVKANFILNVAKFIEWEEEEAIERFRIGVLGGGDVFEALKRRSGEALLKNKAFDVVQFKRADEASGIHILYVNERRNRVLKKILETAIAEHILMFTDSCSTADETMVNLLALDMPGNQFEINKDNIDKARLYVPPKLLYYGGSEEDLREMYQASERQLSDVKAELEQQTAALKKQQKELETKKREILALNVEIALQEGNLESMIARATAQQDSLDQKIAMLEEQRSMIREQQADIDEQNARLQRQKQEIEAGNAFLNRQKQEIEAQEQKIKSQQQEIQAHTQTLEQQNLEIEAQTLKIEKQRTILYLFIALFALTAAMIFFILRAYRIKREANKKLEEKNAAISRQKEEIQAHQKQLEAINRKIERQNENIKSSINYALTIQQALLPSREELEKYFEPFVLYRPRDIVSGDFYWMSAAGAEEGKEEKVFVAVADCTGHGVPGGFLSMIGIKLLASIVNERKEHEPRKILEMLDTAVREALQQERKVSDDGMDVCLCRIEKNGGDRIKITFSGARRPLYYSSNQKINILPGDRKTVGGRVFKGQAFTNRELWLAPGDRIYMASDGIADQNAPNRKKFGSQRLIKLLEETMHLPLHEQKEVVEKTLDDFQQNEKQRDDISLMAIKF